MVAVGVDLGAVEFGGLEVQGVAFLGDGGAAFGQLGAQGVDALAFLHAQSAEVGEGDGAAGERGEDDGGHDAVAEVDSARDLGGHGDEARELGVDLPAGDGPVGDLDGFAKDIDAPEEAAAGGVGLDGERAAAVGEGGHHFLRHVHVGGLVELGAGEIDDPLAAGGNLQQRGSELRAFADADGAAGLARAAAMEDGGQAVVGGVDAVAEAAQGAEEFLLRPLVHAIDAMQPDGAVAQADHRGEEARSGACIAHEEVQWRVGGTGVGNASGEALDGDDAVAGLGGVRGDVDLKAQRAQSVDHETRVLAP